MFTLCDDDDTFPVLMSVYKYIYNDFNLCQNHLNNRIEHTLSVEYSFYRELVSYQQLMFFLFLSPFKSTRDR